MPEWFIPVISLIMTGREPVALTKQLILSMLWRNAWPNFKRSVADACRCFFILFAISRTSLVLNDCKLMESSSGSPCVIRRLSTSSWRCLSRAIRIFSLTFSRIVVTALDFSSSATSDIFFYSTIFHSDQVKCFDKLFYAVLFLSTNFKRRFTRLAEKFGTIFDTPFVPKLFPSLVLNEKEWNW